MLGSTVEPAAAGPRSAPQLSDLQTGVGKPTHDTQRNAADDPVARDPPSNPTNISSQMGFNCFRNSSLKQLINLRF